MPLSRSFETAFAERPDLQQRITQSSETIPALEEIFEDVATFIRELQGKSQAGTDGQGEPTSKKRKLEHRPHDSAAWAKGNHWSFADISFSIPQRKKLYLEFDPSLGVRAATLATGATEFAVSWDSIHAVFCVPLPEKAQAQYNFCLFSDDTVCDQILWTVPDAIPKEGSYKGLEPLELRSTYRATIIKLINDCLKKYQKHVIEPSKDDFASQIVQAHRKGETAYHVKAFRGSKDGCLFLLSTGIIWGFKKPLEFFAFDAIESVSYTSVLQRTFNLNVAIRPSNEASIQEFEFSMIDQADFAGIDAYVKKHGLQDASMAEQRRAKKLNINGTEGETTSEGDGEREGELEKATREAEDLEDEEEEEDENFDPGSEGESEGSGSSSEEEDDGGGQGHNGGTDLVDEELGSEVEDLDE